MIPMLEASVRPGGITQAQVSGTKSKLAQMETNLDMAEMMKKMPAPTQSKP